MFQRVLNPLAVVVGFGLGTVVAFPAWAASHAEVSLGTVLARVGETEITLGHVIAATSALSPEQQQLPPEQLFDGLLRRLIQQEAVAQAADAIDPLNQLQLENERRSLIASQVVEGIAASIAPTEEQIQSAYDRRFADFTPDREFNASHILVETEEEALAIIAELNSGAEFATVAREKSTGPSGPNGGNLGWFGPGRMVPSFEAAVTGLELGAVSAPVETQFGWHVITLNDSRIPEIPTLQELQPQLAEEVTRTLFNAELSALIEQAPVEQVTVEGIDPMLLLDPSPLLDQ